MENEPRGRVMVSARIENLNDVENRERGLISANEVRATEVNDALGDTGASSLLLPKSLIARLRLRHFRTRPARGVGGAVEMRMYSAVRLTIQGRECALDVGEIDDSLPILIGQIPLEALDWVVDPQGQRLIGNPEHGGEHIMEAYGIN